MDNQTNAATIMIVDDTPTNLQLLEELLHGQGYRVVAFPNGALALKAATKKPPDLILLDIMMPDMDGFEVCQQLKTDEKLRDIPVIFLSALNETLDKVKAFSLGGVDYMTKPFQEGEVLSRIKNHLNLRRQQLLIEAQKQQLEQNYEQLRHVNQQLIQAAQAKDDFLANMSHELRTPLNAILGLSEVLQEQVYGPLTEKQTKSIRIIEESGRHLLALINDVLDVAKMEAGKFELDIAPVEVSQLCQSSLRLIKQAAHKKRIKVTFQLDEDVITIAGDERRLKQMLVNLFSNAVKFTATGGLVGLEVKGLTEEEQVHFIVWDTGIGINSTDMRRLFQPFSQIDSSLTRQHTGTGLGLVMVKHLAEMHGGDVSVTSDVGQGSRFTVSLPWTNSRPQPANQNEETPSLPSTMASLADMPLILLAEDNDNNILTIKDFLEAHGFRLIVAHDGVEAVQLTFSEQPNLILMDIQMPKLDGLQAIQQIRETLTTIPIIALTALAMPNDRKRCLNAGANDYMSKPVSLKGLHQTIITLLNQ